MEDVPREAAHEILEEIAQHRLVGAAPAVELGGGFEQEILEDEWIPERESLADGNPIGTQDARDVAARAVEPGMIPRSGLGTIKMAILRRPDDEHSGRPDEVSLFVAQAHIVMKKHEKIIACALRAIDLARPHRLMQAEAVKAEGFPRGLANDVQLEAFHG